METVSRSVNLEELRTQLSRQLALVLLAIGSLGTWIVLYTHSEFFPMGAILALLAALGWVMWKIGLSHYKLACHLLTWSMLTALLASMGLIVEPWLPFLGLLLVFINTVLFPNGGVIVAGMVTAWAIWLNHSGLRAYPLPGLIAALGLAVTVAWLTVHTLYTALEWAWTMQQRADQLLSIARDRQGELNKALKSLDTTNYLLRRTQRELITARKEAEDARRAKEQFAAHVSHELRTPLNIIVGFSELMYTSPWVYGLKKWPASLRQDIYQVYHSARHLLEMINDVLDLSRFESAGFTLNKESVEVKPLLEETMEIVAGLARGRPIQLRLDCPDDLPALEIDRVRIRQVLLNLLNNALRFTEQGEVRLTARQVNDEIIFSVSDTGPGIAPSEMPHLFQEFYQGDLSLNRRHGGTGLGLAISKHFVEAHEGRIWAESEPGLGATFSFALPLVSKSASLARIRDSRPIELSEHEERPVVLVVDRDPGVAKLVERYLQRYEIVPCEESARLPEAIALYHPQAVILNIPPGKRADSKSLFAGMPVPVIECSLPSRAWIEVNLRLFACLTKPVTAEQLLKQIERLPTAREVLVIDDDRGFCLLVERILESSGRPFSVRRAYSGEEGLNALREQRPDVVLLDVGIPGMDGFAVLEILRQEGWADLPVILITAASLADDFLAQQDTEIVISRPDRLRLGEVLGCLQAVLGVLRPHYDERTPSPQVTEHPADAGHSTHPPG